MKPLRRCFLLPVLLLLSGCGTTHYFVPAQPLGEEESAVYVTWHYDLRGLNAPNPVPDFHFYYGVGDDANIGIGLALPVFISHLSAARYWSAGEDFRYTFMHLGQIAGTNMNPFVEAGFGYSLRDRSTSQQFEIGLAYGNGTASPLVLGEWASGQGGGNRSLIPLARYQVSGKDAGASVQYYHGITRTHLRNLERIAERNWEGPDRLLRAEDVDSAAFYPDSISNSGNDHLIIFLKSGWQYDLLSVAPRDVSRLRRGDVFPIMFFPTIDLQQPQFPPDSLPLMSFRGLFPGESNASFLFPNDLLIGPVDSIAAALQRGEDVQLRSYTDIQAEILRQWQTAKRGFWNDLSIGAAIITR